MRDFFDSLKGWGPRLAELMRWPPRPSRRVLLALGVAIIGVVSLASIGIYALVNDSGGPAQPLGTGGSVLDTTPVHQEQELVDPNAGPVAPPEAEAPSGDSGGGSAPSAPVESGMRLVVESLGINAPVITLGLDASNIPEVPLTANQVAWYNFSAAPGGPSNAVFSGHVTWRGQAVFYRLPDLAPGSTVKVVTPDGTVYTYEVFRNILVNETDTWVMAPTGEPIITLITCGGSWVPDSGERFGGDYTGRTVVQARLVSG